MYTVNKCMGYVDRGRGGGTARGGVPENVPYFKIPMLTAMFRRFPFLLIGQKLKSEICKMDVFVFCLFIFCIL